MSRGSSQSRTQALKLGRTVAIQSEMARRKNDKQVDAEIDLHGKNADEARLALESRWPQWQGMRRVRVIHGRGRVLGPVTYAFCADRGIRCEDDGDNEGSMLIFPRDRVLPAQSLPPGIRIGKLRQPEQPKPAAPASPEERSIRQQRMDESLWTAEINRLTVDDRRRKVPEAPGTGRDGRRAAGAEPQDELWKAELARLKSAGADELVNQKRTGLDRAVKPKIAPPAAPPKLPQTSAPMAREGQATEDSALFEAEMLRLEQEDRS